MKMLAVLLVLVATSFGGFSTYQENVINIQGNAKITVVPDIATFFIGASSISNDVDSAILNCKSATLKLNEIIAKYKIKSQDIKSDKLTVSDNYEFIEGKRVRTGCKVLKTYVDPKSFSYENVFVDITAIPEPKFVKSGAIAGSTKVNSALKELFTINIGTIDITNSVYVTYSIAK
jgi:hypothetical protein